MEGIQPAERRRSPMKIESILTSFPLQVALYFNVLVFPFHLMIICIAMYFKIHLLTLTYRVIIFSALIVHLSSEATRLALGYYGNLTENMSALSGFLITSSLIQSPLTLFLIFNTSYKKLPVEYMFLIFIFLFNCVEIYTAIIALKNIASREMKKFADMIKTDGEVAAELNN